MPSTVDPFAKVDGTITSVRGAPKKAFANAMKQGLKNPHHYVDGTTISDGTTDARAAIVAADADGPTTIPPGIYAIASNMTLTNTFHPDNGAVLKPANGVAISIPEGFAAEDLQQIVDLSSGGTISVAKRSYITPEHLGALGRGVDTEDDHVALQAAMDIAIEQGIELYSPGQYYVSDSLEIDATAEVKTVFWRGNGYARSYIKAMDAMPNTSPLIKVYGAAPLGLSNSRISDISFNGAKPDGNRLSVVFDAEVMIGCVFDHVRVWLCTRICFKLGYNYSNTFLSCFFQPYALDEDAWFNHGFVCTHATNNANVFLGCTFHQANGFGYMSLASGQGNSFINCRPESCKAGGYFINGGVGWTFDGYVEACGYSASPHQFITQFNSDTLLPGGPWSTNSAFVFNGSGRQFNSDVSTTATGTTAGDTVTVASATGLYRGAKIELVGAGTAGNTLYARIDSISGTTITLDQDLITSVTDAVFLQPIQPSCDYATTYKPEAVTVNAHGWTPYESSSFYSLAGLKNSSLSMPGAGSSTGITDGTNKILEIYGTYDGISGVTFDGGPLPETSTGSNYLEVISPNYADTPGNPSLAAMKLPWASKTIATLDPSDFTPTNGTITDSGWTYQGKTLWLWQTTTNPSYIPAFVDIDLAEYPEFSNKYMVLEVDCIQTIPQGSGSNLDGGLRIRADNFYHNVDVNAIPTGSVTTTGTITAASSSLTVASATGMVIGKIITVDGAGADANTPLIAKITAISGTTITLGTAATTSVTDGKVIQPQMSTLRKTFKTSDVSVDQTIGILMYLYGPAPKKYGTLISEIRVREVGS